jgi:hypothetical protein
MSKKISEIFDIEPVKPPELPTVYEPNQDVNDDAELARKNIIKLLEIGNNAVEEAAQVANSSEAPRAYEVLSNMLKTLSDMNSQLMDIHEKKKKIKGPEVQQPAPGTVTNNIAFVGTTAELNKIIMERLNQKS